MANFFEDVLDDAKNVEERILGPDYEYWKQINSPKQMGMSSEGSVENIAKDVGGLINYVELLVTGKGGASKTGKPLGDKFFLKTPATCKDKKSGKIVDRYLYVDNVPDGSIPFISAASGMNFSTFEGLVPGTLGNLSALNPMLLFRPFMSGSQPECQEITLETINENNRVGRETRHVTVTDIKNMNPCSFGSKNPVSGRRCIEAFTNKKRTYVPDDFLVQMFYASLGIIGIYILICIMKRIKDRK